MKQQSTPWLVSFCTGLGSMTILSNLYDRLDSHVLPDWSDYVHLRELSLGNVGLEGTLPASLGNLPALRHLDLHNNKFHGSLPADWGLMENLKFLDLSLPRMDLAARLVSSLPASWKDLIKLQVLDLRNQNIYGAKLSLLPIWVCIVLYRDLTCMGNYSSSILGPQRGV